MISKLADVKLKSEERTSSTHALTMYRHTHEVDGKDYLIGRLQLLTFLNLAFRSLGYCWLRDI
jgi:hypothetical protein